MALREILIWPDPRLKQQAKPVGAVDAAIRKLCDDMAETMYESHGVDFTGRDGKPHRLEASNNLLSVCVQHEMDHLVGKLFVDHLSALKRELIRRRMKRLKAQRAAEKKGEATAL